MSVIVEFSVAAERFPLGEVFEDFPTARIDVEQLIPRGETLMPFFWIQGSDPELLEERLATDEYVQSVRVLDAFDDQALVRVEWALGIDGLVQAIIDHDAVILEAVGTADRWHFSLRLPDTRATTAFQQHCHTAGISLDVTKVHHSGGPAQTHELTPSQREVLEVAFQNGYFAIPRETKLVDLAEALGISDQAVSERLRRSQAKLVRAHLESTASETAAVPDGKEE